MLPRVFPGWRRRSRRASLARVEFFERPFICATRPRASYSFTASPLRKIFVVLVSVLAWGRPLSVSASSTLPLLWLTPIENVIPLHVPAPAAVQQAFGAPEPVQLALELGAGLRFSSVPPHAGVVGGLLVVSVHTHGVPPLYTAGLMVRVPVRSPMHWKCPVKPNWTVSVSDQVAGSVPGPPTNVATPPSVVATASPLMMLPVEPVALNVPTTTTLWRPAPGCVVVTPEMLAGSPTTALLAR